MMQLHDLSLGYPGRVLLEGAGAVFTRGGFAALTGRNGTGKSTLLRTLAGLAQPLTGYVTLEGRRLDSMSAREVAARISFVSTEPVRVANLRVADAVGLGRAPYTNWIGHMRAEDREIVLRSLQLVGMEAFMQKGMDTLSDGERQRVMIARALAQDTPVILLDEPTAFLDLPNRYEICLLLRELARREGKTIIFSTHDLNVAMELCDTVAVISDNSLTHGATDQMAHSGAIQRLFDGTRLSFDPENRSVRVETP